MRPEGIGSRQCSEGRLTALHGSWEVQIVAEDHGIPERVMLSYLQGEIEGESAVKNLPVAELHNESAGAGRFRRPLPLVAC